MWQFDFSDPEGPQLGTVALPPSNAVQLAEDPVAIVTQNDVLGISVSNDDITEVLVIIDRARTSFTPSKFFAFAGPDDSVEIRWFDALPQGYNVLGRVELVVIPFLESMKKKASGFLEEEDDFNF